MKTKGKTKAPGYCAVVITAAEKKAFAEIEICPTCGALKGEPCNPLPRCGYHSRRWVAASMKLKTDALSKKAELEERFQRRDLNCTLCGGSGFHAPKAYCMCVREVN